MERSFACIILAYSALLLGCGGSESASVRSDTNVPPPEVAVAQFLEAVRSGNDEQAASMLTPLARQKTSEIGLQVVPQGSDTASFTVGEVEYIAEDGAHVASQWTDVDENHQPHTDPVVWMVRRESDGWRIAGMATKVFDDQPPLFLNFEDPEDMLRKQKLVAEEVQRRSAQAGAAAGQASAIRR
jgi:hypothetical protein